MTQRALIVGATHTSKSDELFLVHFAHIHESFRKPELDSLAVFYNIPLSWELYVLSAPYAIVRLPNAAAAAVLVQRAILAKGIYALWGSASDYTRLHGALRARMPTLASPYMARSFKFSVESFQHHRTQREQRALIDDFAYLALDGAIRMKDPDLHFVVFEEFTTADCSAPKRVALGLFLAGGSRADVERFNLKKRRYIGTTSMDAELSLVTGNMALAGPGKLVYDPFCGTGSFLVACGHQGAMTLGSDIDGRQIRGRSTGRNVLGNFRQYGLSGQYLDCFVSDLTNSPLRKVQWLDAIVCDPPYGVREGLKVLGHRDPAQNGGDPVLRKGVLRHTEPDYIPPKKPYSFLAILDDILQCAVDYLVPDGRLCFWMPTTNEENNKLNIPIHPQLELLNVSVQEFNKWSRCLLTYSRRHGDEGLAEYLEKQSIAATQATGKLEGTTANELNDFRKKYFEGFRQTTPTATITSTPIMRAGKTKSPPSCL